MTAYDPSVMTTTAPITATALASPSPSQLSAASPDAGSSGAHPALLTGAQLRRMRKQAGWSQRELADRLGCSQQQVAAWETGRFRIPSWRLPALRDVLLAAHLERAQARSTFRQLMDGIEAWPTVGEW